MFVVMWPGTQQAWKESHDQAKASSVDPTTNAPPDSNWARHAALSRELRLVPAHQTKLVQAGAKRQDSVQTAGEMNSWLTFLPCRNDKSLCFLKLEEKNISRSLWGVILAGAETTTQLETHLECQEACDLFPLCAPAQHPLQPVGRYVYTLGFGEVSTMHTCLAFERPVVYLYSTCFKKLVKN